MSDQAGAYTPESIYKAVERVLDECSAWIARPNDEVTRKVALAAGIAWSLHEQSTAAAMAEELSICKQQLQVQAEELERLAKSFAKYENEIEQILGRALGYPKYCDDPTNFPDATEVDGVCVGEHVAVTLAQEVAKELERLRDEKAQMLKAFIKYGDHTNFAPKHFRPHFPKCTCGYDTNIIVAERK